ncbi:MAG: diaminopimelate decarboxylase [Sumerlaeia bacterium]
MTSLSTHSHRPFAYGEDGVLHCDGVRLDDLAREHGTPLFVYGAGGLRRGFRRIRDAFAAANPMIAYSVKANDNLAILKLLDKEGAAFDIVSGGELERIRRAGISGDRVIFAGVGKTFTEIRDAIRYGVREFNVESLGEAERIATVAQELGTEAAIALRVNPEVDAKTHAYITTGKKENKFGMAWEDVLKLCERIAGMKGLRLEGLHAHIGSQILDSSPHQQATAVVDTFLTTLAERGMKLKTLNFGGGFGISYRPEQKPLELGPVAEVVVGLAKRHGLQLFMEPGRSIVGPIGALVTEVQYIKPGREKTFVIVDGAMTELIRPSLYQAYHEIVPVRQPAPGATRATVDVVGPVCESADFLAQGREMIVPASGEFLAVLDAGAYCSVMSTNYNARCRPAEILIEEDGEAHVVRHRQTYDDLLRHESVPSHLE